MMHNNNRPAEASIIGTLIIGSCLAACAVAIGVNLPMDRNRTYELVQIHGDESDIVDYGLSAVDCGFLKEHLTKHGHVAECERTR
jgi:hypothetical protein